MPDTEPSGRVESSLKPITPGQPSWDPAAGDGEHEGPDKGPRRLHLRPMFGANVCGQRSANLEP